MKAPATALFLALTVLAAAQGAPPYAGGGAIDKATLARLTAAQAKADAAFKRNPKAPAARKAFLDANNRHGLACMKTDALDRKVKYRMALADFRKVLKVDPKNPVARENTDLIVSIYKSMGRPVPN